MAAFGRIRFEVKGDKRLELALKTFPYYVERRIVKRALRFGSNPIIRAARDRAPVRSGNLRAALAITQARKIKRYGSNFVAVIGPSTLFGPHGHLVERGTKERKTKTGVSRGRMPAQPFLEPAIRTQYGNAMQIIQDKLREGIEREAKRAAKGG